MLEITIIILYNIIRIFLHYMHVSISKKSEHLLDIPTLTHDFICWYRF